MAKIKKPAPKKVTKQAKKPAKRPARKLTERQADQQVADGLRAERYASTADDALMQALHDPENQPSQYGTVPLTPETLKAWEASIAPKKPLLARWRSAITGLFVPKTYAEANPDTTVRERAD